MAHKKGQGSTRNGRDSNPQYRGVKRHDGQLVKAAIAGNNYTLQFSESDEGVFQYLKPQNALVIWHGLMFYLSPFELFFFSQHDIALMKKVVERRKEEAKWWTMLLLKLKSFVKICKGLV